MSNAASEGLVVKEITDTAGWDTLKAPWQQLYQASPSAAPTLSWEWLRTWWQIYGPIYGLGDAGSRGLRIQTVWRGEKLVAALPLYLRAKAGSPLTTVRLCLLSSAEDEFEETCAEYLDLLHLPGEGEACGRLLADRLLTGPCVWDELDFSHLAADGVLARIFPQEKPALTLIPDRPSYVVDLSNGFDAYVQGLSSKTRSYARRLVRQAEDSDARFECAVEPAQIDEFFAQLVELHQARWLAVGKPGTFAAARFKEFHHRLCHQLCGTGGAVLARLIRQDRPLGVMAVYLHRDMAHYYLSGACREDQIVKSPGIALNLLVKRHLAGRGFRVFDYLPGGQSYKVHYVTGERPMVRLRLTRPTLRTGLQAATTLARRVARRLSRVIGRKASTTQAPPPDSSP